MGSSEEFDDLLLELGSQPVTGPTPPAPKDDRTEVLKGGRSSAAKPAPPAAGQTMARGSPPPPSIKAEASSVLQRTPPPQRTSSPPSDATEVVPGDRQFPNFGNTDRTAGGRKRSESRPPLDFSKNHKIGRFEMIREIARGGMGQVFLARDTKLGRKVAIKFLLRDDPDFVQRFLIEARATARCTHENIITIYEVDEHEGLPYMVLEYLEGKTFSGVLESKPSQRQLVEIMVAVARALERAHEHGIVHRDLKPNNVFVTDRGQVKVLDFGVARLMDRQGGTTAAEPAIDLRDLQEYRADQSVSAAFTSNSLVGTLPFMSPEQWGADVVDHLSDIWAVGIMFWRSLANYHPVGSTAPEKLRDHLTNLDKPLPSIGSREPSLPPELVAIVDRCLAKRKADRWQSATQLLAALQAFLIPASERNPGDVCPFRGLAAFGEDDAKYFFGRSNEIRTALAQLTSWPMLAVIGPSGVGKSSFVHAGLVPALRASGGNWHVAVLRPGRAPLLRLGGVIDDVIGTGEPSPDVVRQLRDEPGSFGTLLRGAAARRKQQIVLVVDQLEELFTLCDSDAIRQQFLAALLAAADDPSSPVRVVLSMRADFLDRLAGHKHFLSELSRGLFFLTAPDHENMRETLVRPAELAGFAFEDPQTVEDMLQVATSRGALPLLSFAATRLWDARDVDRKLLTRAAYEQMGGVGGAFARHADNVANAVPPQSQSLLRAIMTRLVTPEGTRAVVDLKELLSLSEEQGAVERIVDQLVSARLVHLETEQDHGSTVEIVHETLITEWPMMRRWLDDSQAIRGFMHELRQAARQWVARNKPNDLVWRGPTAQEALGHARRHVLDLSADERAYLAAVEALVARTRRRRFAVVSALIVALSLVIAGGAVALLRIKAAEKDARVAADDAVKKRQEAEAAKGELQGKLDIIQAEKAAREAAEQERIREEEKRRAAEQDLEKSKELSREQLEAANAELREKVREAQAAREKSALAEASARKASADALKASAEAQAAKKQTEVLLAKERAAREKLEREKKNIYNGDLTNEGNK